MTRRNIKSTTGRLLLLAISGIVLAACTASNGGKTSDALDLRGGTQTQANDESANLRAFCPKTVLRAGTETYRVFTDGVNKDDPDALSSLRFQSTISEVVRECNYRSDQLNIRVGIAGRAISGPTGESGTFNMPVRVAVTRGDEVLYSQLHAIPATIPIGGSFTKFRFVDSNVNIPIPDKPDLVIHVGFDEGPAEPSQETPEKKLKPVN